MSDQVPAGRRTPVWATRVRAAAAASAAAKAVEEQTIRDALAQPGVGPADVAAVLGVRSRGRIYRIDDTTPPEPTRPTMPRIVYLRGTGQSKRTWDRMHHAMWARGWNTVTEQETAWHFARGGARVVMVNFSVIPAYASRPGYISVVPVQAKCGEHGERQLLPLNLQSALVRRGTGTADPATDTGVPRRRAGAFDVDAVARMVGKLITPPAVAAARPDTQETTS